MAGYDQLTLVKMKHNMDAFINPRYDRKKVRVSSENQKPDKQLLEQLVDLHDELSIKFKLHVSSCHMNVNFCKYFQNLISHENSSPKFQLSIFVLVLVSLKIEITSIWNIVSPTI